MNREIWRLSRWIVVLTLAMIAVSGCKRGEENSADVMELFAQAQELQKNEKYEDAVRTYREIIREHPQSHQATNSQFMIGYIYANHIKDYEQARIELNRFINEFGERADSGLVAGAKFELNYLGKDINEIPVLSGLQSADTTDTDTLTAGH